MKYSYSLNDENFTGEYDSPMAAAIEGFLEERDHYDGDVIFVGEISDPVPEAYIDADVILEHITCQDAFLGDHAEGWPEASKEQLEELEKELRAVFIAWMERHDLRPTFWYVNNSRKITREEAQKHTTENLSPP